MAPILKCERPKGCYMKRLTSAIVLTALVAMGYQGGSLSARVLETESLQDQIQARLSDRQVQAILTRIRSNTESLLTVIDGTRPRGRIFGSRTADDPAYIVDDLLQATLHLSDHVTRREATRTDVDDLLGRADALEEAMRRDPGPAAAQTAWRNIQRDVESLAAAYSITWDWQNPQYPGMPGTGIYQRLTGTYQIDSARSENPQRVIDAALRTMPAANRARITRQLSRRLDPPSTLAIDRNNRQVTIASSLAEQVTFEADGQTRTEPGLAGRNVSTRAALYGDRLEVTTTGAANLEYAVTFEPLNGGQDLQVTRRIYDEALAQPVSLRTVYRRTSATPDWTLSDRPADPVFESGGMIVPDGTTLVASLNQQIDLRNARDDDPVTLVVRNAPRQELEGATIEGYIRARSTNNANQGVVVAFDQIRLRNGRSSEFDGIIERVVGPNGESVRFDGEEATVADRDSTQRSVERGAIGAAVGAILGAIVGGGKGAAIGAVVGGGGAAATVLLDKDTQTQLLRGTQFTIRSRSR
jgi:hypothetical protein